MLQRVLLEGVKLPRLYIAENLDDVKQARSKGIPYVRWNLGMDQLIKQLLRPTLEEMFPYIKWDTMLGKKDQFKTKIKVVKGRTLDEGEVDDSYDNSKAIDAQMKNETSNDHRYAQEEIADIASEKREFSGSGNTYSYCQQSIGTYVGDLSAHVNIEVLQSLNLLPKFIGDIVDCIKVNLSNNMRWREGYNKKRGVPIGTYGGSGYLPNLIILDVSGSIPRGISATMLTLIDTMRTELDADLIITASRSVYYPHGSELPTPQAMRDYFGYSNEAGQFYSILKNHIAGRKWGHVISFGDNDAPANYKKVSEKDIPEMVNTSVMAVHHYHTGYGMSRDELKTGYAEWVHEVNPSVEEHYDTSWCSIVRD